MMKVGIMTFQETNNYGAILQNYALQKALQKLGAEAETIDYKSEYIAKPYRLSHLKRKGLFGYGFGLVGYICYAFRGKNNKKFRKNISYSKPVCYEELKSLNGTYDKFIAGSDQVWNYNLTGHDDAYCLNFVDDCSKKCSYAASLGVKEVSEEDGRWFVEKLADYNHLLVRERSAAALLTSLLKRDVTTVLDPVFLLKKEEWNEVIPERLVKEKYIAVYQLGISKEMVQYAKETAKKYGCKLIFLPFPMIGLAKGKYHISAGAAEVLNYLYYADYVITDSFHGTALSIIFQKKFTTHIGGTHGKVNSRISDMLEMFGLSGRAWSSSLEIDSEIVYEKVAEIMDAEREKSYGHLKCLLEK